MPSSFKRGLSYKEILSQNQSLMATRETDPEFFGNTVDDLIGLAERAGTDRVVIGSMPDGSEFLAYAVASALHLPFRQLNRDWHFMSRGMSLAPIGERDSVPDTEIISMTLVAGVLGKCTMKAMRSRTEVWAPILDVVAISRGDLGDERYLTSIHSLDKPIPGLVAEAKLARYANRPFVVRPEVK